jgi:hypothetical protein
MANLLSASTSAMRHSARKAEIGSTACQPGRHGAGRHGRRDERTAITAASTAGSGRLDATQQ